VTADSDSFEARAEILRRIRASGSDQMVPAPPARDYQLRLPKGVNALELFAERVADYRALVHVVDQDDLPARIGRSLKERGARRIVVPEGVEARWLAGTDVEQVRDAPPLSYSQLDELDGVITGCAVAIAVTGTIVLDAGQGQGRRALSLLPDYHLCVVTSSQIVGTVPEAMAKLDARKPLTWISGPSATSDIELERVEGVHGPRNLVVVIVR